MISSPPALSAAAPPLASKPGLSSDFETFLKMLTTQIRNQDPLNPMQASDFAAQLATFSNVEQSVRTNQLLEGMQAQFGLLTLSQLAGWVGQEARVAAPIGWSGQPVPIAVSPAPNADRAILVTKDAQGAVLSREDVAARSGNVLWQGRDARGAPLPPGSYLLELESYAGEQMLRTDPVEHYAIIAEVRGGPGQASLVLRGGAEVPAASVTAVRKPVAG